MSTFWGENAILVRNSLIIYLLVGVLASCLADFHRNYQESLQADNAGKFSRVISLGVAYQAKQIINSR